MNPRNREAMEARLAKEAHPKLWCRAKRCLWRLARGLCPNHFDAPENMTKEARADQARSDHDAAMDATEELPLVEMAEDLR